jgi:hypothetical protein
MTAPAFVKRSFKQTLVWWANPVNDGYNNYTFDAPVEILGRCESALDMVLTEDGEEVLAKAHVYLDEDIKEGEYLYLGTLADLDSAPVPSTTDRAMRIIAFSEVPTLNSGETLMKAYLNKPYFNR